MLIIVFIFFKHKIITDVKSWLHNEAKDLIYRFRKHVYQMIEFLETDLY